jgi:hypothetical protein
VICVAAIRLAMRHLIQTTKFLESEPVRKQQPGVQPTNGKAKPWFEELFGIDQRTITSQWQQQREKTSGLEPRVIAYAFPICV